MKKRHFIFTTAVAALSLSFLFPVISSADSFSDNIKQQESLIVTHQEKIKTVETQQMDLEKQLKTGNLQLKDLAENMATLSAQLKALNQAPIIVEEEDNNSLNPLLPFQTIPVEQTELQPSLSSVKKDKEDEFSKLAQQLKTLQDQQKSLKTKQATTAKQKEQQELAIKNAQKEIEKLKAQQTAYYAKENLRNRLVDAAYSQLGKPYVWGGQGPNVFDCSGLMNYLYTNVAGLSIGSWTVPQETSGRQIAVSQAKAGDLLFWGSHGATTHVAMYIGNGQYIHAPKPGDVVKITALSTFTPNFAVNVLG